MFKFVRLFEFNFFLELIFILLVVLLLLNKILGLLELFGIGFIIWWKLVLFSLLFDILKVFELLNNVNFLIFLVLLFGFWVSWNFKLLSDFIFGILEKFKFNG